MEDETMNAVTKYVTAFLRESVMIDKEEFRRKKHWD